MYEAKNFLKNVIEDARDFLGPIYSHFLQHFLLVNFFMFVMLCFFLASPKATSKDKATYSLHAQKFEK